MVSLLPTKFHEIMFSSFRGVALTSCFSRKFGKFLSSKGHNSHKIQAIKISWKYAQLHIVSLLSTKFHEILFSSFRGVALKKCVTDRRTDGEPDRRTGQKQYVSHKRGGSHNDNLLNPCSGGPDIFPKQIVKLEFVRNLTVAYIMCE